MCVSSRAYQHVFPVVTELELRPDRHTRWVRKCAQEWVVGECEGSEWLFVVVAQVVEQDCRGCVGGDGKDDAGGIEGSERG